MRGITDAEDAGDDGEKTVGQDFERLRAEFADHSGTRHLALFYESPAFQRLSVAAFVDTALRSNQRCLYLADDNTPAEIERAFGAVGIDVPARVDAGDLRIREAESVYLDSGFDPDRMIETLEAACRESVEDGYAGLAVAGENTWCFHTGETFDPVLRFEADFDERHPELPVTALCQYDLSRFSEESIGKALWTHESIVYRGRVCENPYYVRPEAYVSGQETGLNVRLMLERTHDFAVTTRELERREQRLSVLNRVLRHNIRNDLNVVVGNLSLFEERADLDEAERENLRTAIDHAQEVVRVAEEARHIQQTLSTPSVEPTDVAAAVDGAVEELERERPAASVDVECGVDTRALADANLRGALAALLVDVVDSREADDPSVTVELRRPTSSEVDIEVRSPGTPVPDTDRNALLEGRETPLEHGTGITLWVLKWVAETAGGRLRFPEADDEYRVRVALPAAV